MSELEKNTEKIDNSHSKIGKSIPQKLNLNLPLDNATRIVATQGLAVFLVVFYAIYLYPQIYSERSEWIREITILRQLINPERRPLNRRQTQVVLEIVLNNYISELNLKVSGTFGIGNYPNQEFTSYSHNPFHVHYNTITVPATPFPSTNIFNGNDGENIINLYLFNETFRMIQLKEPGNVTYPEDESKLTAKNKSDIANLKETIKRFNEARDKNLSERKKKIKQVIKNSFELYSTRYLLASLSYDDLSYGSQGYNPKTLDKIWENATKQLELKLPEIISKVKVDYYETNTFLQYIKNHPGYIYLASDDINKLRKSEPDNIDEIIEYNYLPEIIRRDLKLFIDQEINKEIDFNTRQDKVEKTTR